MSHTPTPWSFDAGEPCILNGANDDETSVIATSYACGPLDEANFARIVACVNACEGFDDPANAIRASQAAAREWKRDMDGTLAALNAVRAERDALRAALNAMWGFASDMVVVRDNSEGDGSMTDAEHEAWQDAAALASNALGGQQSARLFDVELSLTREQAQSLATALDYDLCDLSTSQLDEDEDKCYRDVKAVRALLKEQGL